MTTWYRAYFGKIVEVDVVRSTDKFVVLPNGLREAIDSDWSWYREDREQAKLAMILQAEKELDNALENVRAYEQRLSEARNA